MAAADLAAATLALAILEAASAAALLSTALRAAAAASSLSALASAFAFSAAASAAFFFFFFFFAVAAQSMVPNAAARWVAIGFPAEVCGDLAAPAGNQGLPENTGNPAPIQETLMTEMDRSENSGF